MTLQRFLFWGLILTGSLLSLEIRSSYQSRVNQLKIDALLSERIDVLEQQIKLLEAGE